MDTVPAVLTAQQVAAILGCSYRTIYKRIEKDEIPNIKLRGIKRCPTHEIEKILGRQIQPSDLVPLAGRSGPGRKGKR
jgi:excisionase family DNA binding protein